MSPLLQILLFSAFSIFVHGFFSWQSKRGNFRSTMPGEWLFNDLESVPASAPSTSSTCTRSSAPLKNPDFVPLLTKKQVEENIRAASVSASVSSPRPVGTGIVVRPDAVVTCQPSHAPLHQRPLSRQTAVCRQLPPRATHKPVYRSMTSGYPLVKTYSRTLYPKLWAQMEADEKTRAAERLRVEAAADEHRAKYAAEFERLSALPDDELYSHPGPHAWFTSSWMIAADVVSHAQQRRFNIRNYAVGRVGPPYPCPPGYWRTQAPLYAAPPSSYTVPLPLFPGISGPLSSGPPPPPPPYAAPAPASLFPGISQSAAAYEPLPSLQTQRPPVDTGDDLEDYEPDEVAPSQGTGKSLADRITPRDDGHQAPFAPPAAPAASHAPPPTGQTGSGGLFGRMSKRDDDWTPTPAVHEVELLARAVVPAGQITHCTGSNQPSAPTQQQGTYEDATAAAAAAEAAARVDAAVTARIQRAQEKAAANRDSRHVHPPVPAVSKPGRSLFDRIDPEADGRKPPRAAAAQPATPQAPPPPSAPSFAPPAQTASNHPPPAPSTTAAACQVQFSFSAATKVQFGTQPVSSTPPTAQVPAQSSQAPKRRAGDNDEESEIASKQKRNKQTNPETPAPTQGSALPAVPAYNPSQTQGQMETQILQLLGKLDEIYGTNRQVENICKAPETADIQKRRADLVAWLEYLDTQLLPYFHDHAWVHRQGLFRKAAEICNHLMSELLRCWMEKDLKIPPLGPLYVVCHKILSRAMGADVLAEIEKGLNPLNLYVLDDFVFEERIKQSITSVTKGTVDKKAAKAILKSLAVIQPYWSEELHHRLAGYENELKVFESLEVCQKHHYDASVRGAVKQFFVQKEYMACHWLSLNVRHHLDDVDMKEVPHRDLADFEKALNLMMAEQKGEQMAEQMEDAPAVAPQVPTPAPLFFSAQPSGVNPTPPAYVFLSSTQVRPLTSPAPQNPAPTLLTPGLKRANTEEETESKRTRPETSTPARSKAEHPALQSDMKARSRHELRQFMEEMKEKWGKHPHVDQIYQELLPVTPTPNESDEQREARLIENKRRMDNKKWLVARLKTHERVYLPGILDAGEKQALYDSSLYRFAAEVCDYMIANAVTCCTQTPPLPVHWIGPLYKTCLGLYRQGVSAGYEDALNAGLNPIRLAASEGDTMLATKISKIFDRVLTGITDRDREQGGIFGINLKFGPKQAAEMIKYATDTQVFWGTDEVQQGMLTEQIKDLTHLTVSDKKADRAKLGYNAPGLKQLMEAIQLLWSTKVSPPCPAIRFDHILDWDGVFPAAKLAK